MSDNDTAKLKAWLEASIANLTRYHTNDELFGLDWDHIGFDCVSENAGEDYWACPFRPGCGAKKLSDCPEAKRRAQIHHAPGRKQ